MGRRAAGWRVRYKRGWAYCCFTFQGKEYREALGTKDEREAEKAAPLAYAKVISGYRRSRPRKPGQRVSLADLWADFENSRRGTISPEMLKTLSYYGDRFVDYFGDLETITEASGEMYGVARLREVSRKTVVRELGYLRQFMHWCRRNGYIDTVPFIPPLPPKATGVRAGKQRQKPVDISHKEAMAIIELLPLESKTIRGRKWPIRMRYLFAWETGLRPATLARMNVPEHWRPGANTIEITDPIDKARFGRVLDLTPVAKKALMEAVKGTGLIFGRSKFYKRLKDAAETVLGKTRGKQFADYDFRHGMANHLLDNGGSLAGVAYVLGHKRLTTTNIYVQPSRKEAKKALGVGR